MEVQQAIVALESEWEQPDGFLGALRMGTFSEEGLERLVRTLQSIQGRPGTTIDRRLVQLTWYIPLFMVWQRERVEEQGTDPRVLDRAVDRVVEILHVVLGVP